MKALTKIATMALSVLMLGSCLLLPKGETITANDASVNQPAVETETDVDAVTPVTSPVTNAVTAKKYSVSVTNLGGVGASFLCNNTALTQGDSMTINYTVQAKSALADNTTTEQRFAGVFSKPTQAQAYPVVGTAGHNVTAFDSFQINGADLNRTNAPTLPDTHFGVGSTYQLSLTPQSGNTTYTWTLKKDNTQVSSGSVAYDAYMGIMIYHYQTYRFALSDVSIVTATSDLGVFAYNLGSATHNASVIDGENVPMVTLTSNSIEVSGATATLSDTMGYFGCNSIQLTASSPSMYLYIDGLDAYKRNTRVHVSLRFYLEYATNTADSMTWYSPIELRKEGGLYVDGDMPRNTWNHISYDTVVIERGGRKCVQLSVSGNAGEVMYISALQVSADQTEKKYTLGGCEVYQMENTATLMESYVIITPDKKVIVIDGGDAADAPVLYNFLIQFTHKIDHWFISHYHEDHCMALITMLQSPAYDFQIENLHYNFPTQAQCQAAFNYILSVAPTASDETPSMVQRKAVLDATNTKVKNRVTSQMGQVYEFGGDCRLKVISNPDFDINTNYGNNTSLMYKLETAGENVLFLNDIGDTGDEYIRDNPTINYGGTIPSATFREEIADCAYVQLGHHGQNGPSLNFYNYCTKMRICLYAAPEWIMNCSNGSGVNSATNLVTLATRDFMREKGVYKYYSQEMGRVKLV